MNKNELIVAAVKLFAEFMNKVGVTYDSAYYRFVEFAEGEHVSSKWNFRIGRSLSLAEVSDDLFDSYFTALESLMVEILNSIGNEGHTRPKVIVISLGKSLSYTIKFNEFDVDALDIGIMALGQSNSYFPEGEIDLPENGN